MCTTAFRGSSAPLNAARHVAFLLLPRSDFPACATGDDNVLRAYHGFAKMASNVADRLAGASSSARGGPSRCRARHWASPAILVGGALRRPAATRALLLRRAAAGRRAAAQVTGRHHVPRLPRPLRPMRGRWGARTAAAHAALSICRWCANTCTSASTSSSVSPRGARRCRCAQPSRDSQTEQAGGRTRWQGRRRRRRGEPRLCRRAEHFGPGPLVGAEQSRSRGLARAGASASSGQRVTPSG